MNRRNQVLFLVALVGVLAAVGTLVHALAGDLAAGVYTGVVVALVVVGAARARAAEAARRRESGRTCTCCTTTHFDLVQVV